MATNAAGLKAKKDSLLSNIEILIFPAVLQFKKASWEILAILN